MKHIRSHSLLKAAMNRFNCTMLVTGFLLYSQLSAPLISSSIQIISESLWIHIGSLTLILVYFPGKALIKKKKKKSCPSLFSRVKEKITCWTTGYCQDKESGKYKVSSLLILFLEWRWGRAQMTEVCYSLIK